jgi:signal transduction histidine kinase
VARRRADDRRAVDRRLAAVVEGMSDAFLALDADWRVTYANRECARLNGTTPEALVGCDHWARWPEAAGGEVERQYRHAAAAKVGVRFVHHYPAADVWHAVYAYPAEGGGLAVFYHDVTAEQRALAEQARLRALAEAEHQAARAARAEAEASNQAKAQFLATMSHELRTPLNAIGGYAELLDLGLYGPVTATQRETLARVQRAQRHLLGLINGVLNYAKLGAGAVRYATEAVSLDEVLAACEVLVEPQARAKGLILTLAPRRAAPATTVQPAPGTPAVAPAGAPAVAARADGEKVRQVVLNLLTNAVKFTARGGRVTMAAGVAHADRGAPAAVGAGAIHPAAGGTAWVRVADTGRGIAPDQLECVFEPFVQVDARLTRTEQGTGLGLAISRDLARGMGGDLTAESTLGVGSTFTLTLPAA